MLKLNIGLVVVALVMAGSQCLSFNRLVFFIL